MKFCVIIVLNGETDDFQRHNPFNWKVFRQVKE